MLFRLESYISQIPSAAACIAGQHDFGYIYAAVHDPTLREVRQAEWWMGLPFY